MPAILFDLDGVLYEGDQTVPGADDAVNWFIERDIPHLFLTNTTSTTRDTLVTKLSGLDIQSSRKNTLTPPVAAQQYLHKKTFLTLRYSFPK